MNSQLARGAAWSAVGKLVAVASSVAAVVLIARWIGPQAYGAYALAWVAIALAEIVVGGTLAESLAQAKDVEDGHVDATFWASCALAVAAAAGIALAAVPIAAAVAMCAAVLALSAALRGTVTPATSIAWDVAIGALVYAAMLALLSPPAASAMRLFAEAARRGDGRGMRGAIRQGLRAGGG